MGSYVTELRTFRFWNRLGVALFVGFVPVVMLAALLGERVRAHTALPFIVGIVWVIALAGVVYRIRAFPCPRCHKTATVRNWWSPNTRGRKCVHCALELTVEA